MKQVAIVGIQGVPARYGGFESLVENIIGDNCSPGIQYTVFCSSKDMPEPIHAYKGCKLKYIPLHANGIQSIPYDIIAMIRTLRGYDTLLILGTSGCIFLPVLKLLSGVRIIVNIDGLEHRRIKWGKAARWFLRLSEATACKKADIIIADNKGIEDYVQDTYHRKAELVAYGGNHVIRNIAYENQQEILKQYVLEKRKYAISICRIEPENNCHMILQAFSQTDKRLVFIGNWQHSGYAKKLKEKYGYRHNISLLESIYDINVLFTLRSNAGMYIHGHSAGGTNPSLVEAMFFDCPIICYDVIYNRATTNNLAVYFSNSIDLINMLSRPLTPNPLIKEYAKKNYMWRHIAAQYEALY